MHYLEDEAAVRLRSAPVKEKIFRGLGRPPNRLKIPKNNFEAVFGR